MRSSEPHAQLGAREARKRLVTANLVPAPTPKTSGARRTLAAFSLGVLSGVAAAWLATRHAPGRQTRFPSLGWSDASFREEEEGDHEEGEQEGLVSLRGLSAVEASLKAPNGHGATATDPRSHYPSALLPSTERLLYSPAFVSLVSTAHRQPLFVAERLGGDLRSEEADSEEIGDGTGDRETFSDASRELQGAATGKATGAEPRRAPAARDPERQAEPDAEHERRTEGLSTGSDEENPSESEGSDEEGHRLGRRGLYSKTPQKGLKTTGGVDRRALNFTQDPRIDKLWSADNSDYLRSGYSKGHLAAVALHKDSLEALQSTFSLGANIIPQNQAVNAGAWFKLEVLTKSLARLYEEVYVVSGPLWIPHDLVSRAPLVSVPRAQKYTSPPRSLSSSSPSSSSPFAPSKGAGEGSDPSPLREKDEASRENFFSSGARVAVSERGGQVDRANLAAAGDALRREDAPGDGGGDSERSGEEGSAPTRLLHADGETPGAEARKRRGAWGRRSASFSGLSQSRGESEAKEEPRTTAFRTFACLKPYASAPDVLPVSVEALTGSAASPASLQAFEFSSASSPLHSSSSISPPETDGLEWSFRACREAVREQHTSQTPPPSSASSGKTVPPLHVEHEVIGAHLVPVPTHLFKIVLGAGPRRTSQGTSRLPEVVLGAFVVPNKKVDRVSDMRAFRVPLQFVEWISGLDFQGVVTYAREKCEQTQASGDAGSVSGAETTRGFSSLFLSRDQARATPAGREAGEKISPSSQQEEAAFGLRSGRGKLGERQASPFPSAERRRRRREREETSRFLLAIDLCRTREWTPTGTAGEKRPSRDGGDFDAAAVPLREREARRAMRSTRRETQADGLTVQRGRNAQNSERTHPPTFSFCAPGAFDMLGASSRSTSAPPRLTGAEKRSEQEGSERTGEHETTGKT
ncbi:putative DNA/RNA non-specific endonuclease domain-containing protein [Neospora caninum Liverpool]|uniref:Putative DNA/RNA non-specific endonuclease domain-containing protein n=1 Tax=Neospora caninum (strain Liverpool) TaxID=572307 RepID=F0V7Z6_NEOCL|nr:putative DNA/RNA non-specific endonuclease domain-containing protein [Neospora caninum Liverpool]CBZ49837.1 putative DNA/RNA non-specific endonuclease domain-containing protein [Neospora caninum Liverpool]|eukprot:XP_003879872.1 putative DNA/RNA non-specific endonuclease domain-containing protein [Neospora caninum Liverpool]